LLSLQDALVGPSLQLTPALLDLLDHAAGRSGTGVMVLQEGSRSGQWHQSLTKLAEHGTDQLYAVSELFQICVGD